MRIEEWFHRDSDPDPTFLVIPYRDPDPTFQVIPDRDMDPTLTLGQEKKTIYDCTMVVLQQDFLQVLSDFLRKYLLLSLPLSYSST